MKTLLIVMAAVLVAIVSALAWLGVFGGIEVQEAEMGPYPFVYVQDASADADRIAERTRALDARLEAAGYMARRPAQIRYPAGRGIPDQFGFVVQRAVGPELLGSDTFFRPVPVQRCLVASFPYRLAASQALASMRIEPALEAYREAHDYAETNLFVIIDGERIRYLQPIAPG